MWQKSYENIEGSRWNEDSNKFEKDAFFSATSWLVKSHHVTTSRRAYWSLLLLPGPHGRSHMQTTKMAERRRRREGYRKYMQDNHGKTEMKGTCHICGKNLASTHGFFIEAPIVKQLQTFFEFSEVSLFEVWLHIIFFFQAEDGIRDVERSRGLGDVYKRQLLYTRLTMKNLIGREHSINSQ